jgi:hypothetical protein
MKKILVWGLAMVLAVILSVAIAQAQTWYPVNQATVAWDAVTQLSDGTPIPAGSTIHYVVYSKAPGGTVFSAIGTPVTATQMLITFAVEGQYIIGVKAQRLAGTPAAMVSESDIAWSDVAANVPISGTWGVIYYIKPGAIKNLRKP